MKRLLNGLLFAALLAVPAYAVTKDAVNDERGQVVTDERGNCVRTKWNAPMDECAQAPVVIQSAPQPIPVAQPAPMPEPVKISPARKLKVEQRRVFFEFNKADLGPGAKNTLKRLVNVLKSDADVKSARIVGFADRIGDEDKNIELSKRRAEAVKSYLNNDLGFLKTSDEEEVRWLGESAPVSNCDDKLARPELIKCLGVDRRVEIEIDFLSDE